MRRRYIRGIAVALLIAPLPLLGGCERAPATGRSFFTGGMTPEQEARIGLQENAKVLKQFAGAYDDPDLARYVSGLGTLLAKTSELQDLEFRFTVLDSPIVNAFALPGGYVYVTRGLLALAENEAQLASVLAHEIGHITARHTAERYGQAVLAQAATLGAGILLGGTEAKLLGTGATLVLRGWSRKQEFEADTLGVRYLTRAGFDSDAMAGFLFRLRAQSRLEAELRGEPGRADAFSLLQTHPRTTDRINQAIKAAGVKPIARPIVAREIYLQKIDGISYGSNPKEGVIRGRAFQHPVLRFAFQVPQGFRLFNSRRHVIALGPADAAIIFDRVRVDTDASTAGFLTETWAGGLRLRNVESIDVNSMRAATGQVQSRTGQAPRDLRLVAIRHDANTIYRFLFVTSSRQTAALSEGLRRTTYSFRRLSVAEASRIEPLRLRLYRVRTGDTAAGVARLMAFQDRKLDRFLVLNGLTRNSRLSPGELVKIVTE